MSVHHFREMMNCRVGKGRPAGSIELRVSPPPLKFRTVGFPQYGFKRTFKPATFDDARGLSAVHIRPGAAYTLAQLQLPRIRDPRGAYP